MIDDSIIELLMEIVDDLYELADGNPEPGAWELYDKYFALLGEYFPKDYLGNIVIQHGCIGYP